MSIDIEGVIIKIMSEQSGDGKFGKWTKQEFVIQTEDKFPKKVCFSVWGDRTDELKSMNNGDKVKVSFNPESREYNERWYTDLRAWKIEKANEGNSSSNADVPPPFSENDIPPPDEEDLPF